MRTKILFYNYRANESTVDIIHPTIEVVVDNFDQNIWFSTFRPTLSDTHLNTDYEVLMSIFMSIIENNNFIKAKFVDIQNFIGSSLRIYHHMSVLKIPERFSSENFEHAHDGEEDKLETHTTITTVEKTRTEILFNETFTEEVQNGVIQVTHGNDGGHSIIIFGYNSYSKEVLLIILNNFFKNNIRVLEINEYVPDDVPDDVPNVVPNVVPDNVPNNILDDLPDDVLDYVLDHVPNTNPESSIDSTLTQLAGWGFKIKIRYLNETNIINLLNGSTYKEYKLVKQGSDHDHLEPNTFALIEQTNS